MNQGITWEEIWQWGSFQYNKWRNAESQDKAILVPENQPMESSFMQESTILDDEEMNTMLEEKQTLSIPQMIQETYQMEMPLQGVITSAFGNRESTNPQMSTYHTGIDIAAEQGTNIVAAHDGIVTQAGANGSYGNSVMITSGEITTLYGHCLMVDVTSGEIIKKGQNIAQVGMTGNATGPHVHFEVRFQNQFINPLEILQEA